MKGRASDGSLTPGLSSSGESTFVMDYSMNKIGRYFRLLGYDTICERSLPQSDLVRVASEGHRSIVTCSRALVKQVEGHNRLVQRSNARMTGSAPSPRRHVVAYDSDGESIYSEDSDPGEVEIACYFVEQWTSRRFTAVMIDLIQRCRLTYDARRVFSRCVTCNDLLTPVEKPDVEGRVVPKIYAIYQEFTECPTCKKVFWGFDGATVINYKSFRTLSMLRALCIDAGALVAVEQTRLNRLRCFRSFPRAAKVCIFSYLPDEDLHTFCAVFPQLGDLAEEVRLAHQTQTPVPKFVASPRKK